MYICFLSQDSDISRLSLCNTTVFDDLKGKTVLYLNQFTQQYATYLILFTLLI